MLLSSCHCTSHVQVNHCGLVLYYLERAQALAPRLTAGEPVYPGSAFTSVVAERAWCAPARVCVHFSVFRYVFVGHNVDRGGYNEYSTRMFCVYHPFLNTVLFSPGITIGSLAVGCARGGSSCSAGSCLRWAGRASAASPCARCWWVSFCVFVRVFLWPCSLTHGSKLCEFSRNA